MTDSVPSPSFAQVLRHHRRAAGLTQEELAERAGLSARAVSDLERGENRTPRRDTLDLLADALRLSAEERAALDGTIQRTRAQVSPSAPGQASTLEAEPTRPDTLPTQPTPFIGREREVEAIRARLLDPETRLLTLTGPGGTGKTRLAVQAAAAARPAFADGAIFVPLAPVSDPDLVLSTIAQVLEVHDVPGQALGETLAAALRDKHLLLVLDNVEHVLSAAASIAVILMAVPHVKTLVTSRSAVRVQGERVYPVLPLAVPGPPLPPLAALSQYEAVRLFIARAQDVQPDFAVTNETAPAVAEICARLDGLPLAIELAAARTRLLPPEALLARLSNRLKVVTGGARNLPARQRTLRAAIDWSYDLLDPGEQTLFARLAVFVGGRTLAAIEAVCDAEGDLPIDVLDGVESLLDKSLLRREVGASGEPRLLMLETIHEYARERLEQQGEVDALRQAHAAYFVKLAADAGPKLVDPDQEIWLALLEGEHDNVRAVLQWAHESSQHDLGLRLVVYLYHFWRMRGYSREGYDWAKRFLTAVDRTRVEARLLSRALCVAGVLAIEHRDYDWARLVFEECVRLTKEDGDSALHMRSFSNLGMLMHEQGNDVQALDTFQQVLSIARANGDNAVIAHAVENMGIIARAQGDYRRAVALTEEALALTGRLDNPFENAVSLHNLALNVVGLGDYGRARVLFQQSVSLCRQIGYTRGEVELIEGVADLVFKEGHHERAVRLFGAAAALRVTFSAYRTPSEQAIFDAQIAVVRANLSNDSFTRAWAEGQVLSLEQASDEAY